MSSLDDLQLKRVARKLKASGAVAVVGAGLSQDAGMPLVAELPPLVWHALDADPAARAAVAARLGAPDQPAKPLLGSRSPELKEAFQVLTSYPTGRRAFQDAFARRDSDALLQHSAHDALGRLFHCGLVEVLVSLNWDRLFERCYARRYGRTPVVDQHFWKPHGDAAHPEQDWVLPGEPGQVPSALVEQVSQLVRDRPRLLLVIGYSESDEQIVQLLTEPLSERWEVCRISPHAQGELALVGSANEILPQLARRLVPEPEVPGWEPVIFGQESNLGPALLGRGLGPANVSACPALTEASTLVNQLRIARTARLVGKPGSGKTICAYQAAFEFARDGFEVVRYVDGAGERPDLSLVGLRFPTLAVVDDAHLLPDQTVRRLEEAAGPNLALLSVSQGHEKLSGAVLIDNDRAVDTIAEALSRDITATREAVMRVDDRVGYRPFDIRIEDRIRQAQREARTAWQFCFILGGGWRRTSLAADTAKACGAQITLSAAAIRQLASGDAPASAIQIADLVGVQPDDYEVFEEGVRCLAEQRLILAENDVRCPHQRSAAAVLDQLYTGFEQEQRKKLVSICRSVLGDKEMPLNGVRLLLHEIRFSSAISRVRFDLLDRGLDQTILLRCLSAHGVRERTWAAYLLAELLGFVNGQPRERLGPHAEIIREWISNAEESTGGALGTLINDAWNADQDFTKELCEAIDPGKLAQRAVGAEPKEGWSVGRLLDRLRLAVSDDWVARFKESLDRGSLTEAARLWPIHLLAEFATFAGAIVAFDEDLGLSLVENAGPQLRSRFASAPIEAFADLSDFLMHTLRVWDPLRVYVGPLKADGRRVAIARRLFSQLSPDLLASLVSWSTIRDLQWCAGILAVLRKVEPRYRRRVIEKINFDKLSETLQPILDDLPHEICNLFCQMSSGQGSDPVADWIEKSASKIKILDTRLAYLAPEAVPAVLAHGGRIALDRSMCFAWLLVASVIDSVAERHPDLVEKLVVSHIEAASEAFGRNQVNTYDDVDAFVRVLEERSPGLLSRILEGVSPSKAEVAWAACLKSYAAARRSAATLVEASLRQEGSICEVGERLRHRFPKASIPSEKLSFQIRSPRRTRWRRSS